MSSRGLVREAEQIEVGDRDAGNRSGRANGRCFACGRFNDSDERPNSARRSRAGWKRSLAISAWAATASCAIAVMIRFSASGLSGS